MPQCGKMEQKKKLTIEQEKAVQEAFADVDQTKVDALKDFVKEIRDQLRGTNKEHEILNS